MVIRRVQLVGGGVWCPNAKVSMWDQVVHTAQWRAVECHVAVIADHTYVCTSAVGAECTVGIWLDSRRLAMADG